MIKTELGLRYIMDKSLHELREVSSMTIENYSDATLKMTISDVDVKILPFDVVTGYPGQFTMDGDGTLSDFNINFEFIGAKTGDAILYTRTKKC